MIFTEIYNEYSKFINESDSNIFVYCPYIKVDALKQLKILPNKKLSIITTWKIKDMLEGVSDLELYPYTKSIGAYLYINQRIHLKVITDFNKKALIGSANITNKGLGISERSNYECITLYENMDLYNCVFLNKILHESTLMNDRLFEQFKNTLNIEEGKFKPQKPIEEVNVQEIINKEFLISSLPMSKDINLFYKYYSGEKRKTSEDDEDYKCAVHDLALYDLPSSLDRKGFNEALKKSFFNQRFIRELKNFICEPRYFGSIKEWVQNNCTNVPIPSRRELTGNVQVLYEWFAELGKDEFITDRPNHSQRIYPINAKPNESSIR